MCVCVCPLPGRLLIYPHRLLFISIMAMKIVCLVLLSAVLAEGMWKLRHAKERVEYAKQREKAQAGRWNGNGKWEYKCRVVDHGKRGVIYDGSAKALIEAGRRRRPTFFTSRPSTRDRIKDVFQLLHHDIQDSEGWCKTVYREEPCHTIDVSQTCYVWIGDPPRCRKRC